VAGQLPAKVYAHKTKTESILLQLRFPADHAQQILVVKEQTTLLTDKYYARQNNMTITKFQTL
jgi:hypothetical protein